MFNIYYQREKKRKHSLALSYSHIFPLVLGKKEKQNGGAPNPDRVSWTTFSAGGYCSSG